LSDLVLKENFQSLINNKLPQFENTIQHPQEIMNVIQESIISASKESLGRAPPAKNNKSITPSTIRYIHQKHSVRQQYGNRQNKLQKTM